MKKFLTILIITFMGLNALFCQKKSRDQFKATHVAFITQKLDLTADESQKFWPVYNDHNKKLRELKKSYNLKKYDEAMLMQNPDIALTKINAFRTEEASLKTKLNEHLKSILPTSKIVKLYFAEIEFKEEILDEICKRYKSNKDQKSDNQP